VTGSVVAVTVLAALIVALTWLRLGRRSRSPVPHWHLILGVLGVLVWGTFLAAPASTTAGGDLVGVIGLGLWWLVAIVGLLILARWRRPASRGRRVGRHAGVGGPDRWSQGPWLSILAHGGMVVCVVIMTWAYLTQKV
jgi:hypothetical protein